MVVFNWEKSLNHRTVLKTHGQSLFEKKIHENLSISYQIRIWFIH